MVFILHWLLIRSKFFSKIFYPFLVVFIQFLCVHDINTSINYMHFEFLFPESAPFPSPPFSLNMTIGITQKAALGWSVLDNLVISWLDGPVFSPAGGSTLIPAPVWRLQWHLLDASSTWELNRLLAFLLFSIMATQPYGIAESCISFVFLLVLCLFSKTIFFSPLVNIEVDCSYECHQKKSISTLAFLNFIKILKFLFFLRKSNFHSVILVFKKWNTQCNCSFLKNNSGLQTCHVFLKGKRKQLNA